ncbi:unnamed protein product [Acanthoscelides obtectus]|uniref:Uncharacterized protein n=1 Tax=Acanthoscelides obtectus TaxID=200917 RepID=A0A9P0LU95_ACAOB|nr:unnamed protein product [Acanthoscelides obtectus]CAK1631034.1 hypothetical protein AOBTE_LOCUS6717 [Acanthoscelides obtectus]
MFVSTLAPTKAHARRVDNASAARHRFDHLPRQCCLWLGSCWKEPLTGKGVTSSSQQRCSLSHRCGISHATGGDAGGQCVCAHQKWDLRNSLVVCVRLRHRHWCFGLYATDHKQRYVNL